MHLIATHLQLQMTSLTCGSAEEAAVTCQPANLQSGLPPPPPRHFPHHTTNHRARRANNTTSFIAYLQSCFGMFSMNTMVHNFAY